MASSKSRSASRKSATTRSRSAARKTSPAQTRRSAGDNEPGAAAVNEAANEQARAASASAGGTDVSAVKKLHPAVEAVLLGDDTEPRTSINSVPKDEGGLHADDIATIRSRLDSLRGDSALGQPGQLGHGVGTASAGIAGTMTDEEREADDREYRRRFPA